MPPPDVKAAVRGRQRNLLIVLSVVATAALIYAMGSPGASVKQVSNPRAAKPHPTIQALAQIEARLDDLNQRPPARGEMARDPFKFHIPSRPARQNPVVFPAPAKLTDLRDLPPAPASPPSIPIKFIGVAAQGPTKVAVFTDGKGSPVWASEGQTVLGQYRLLKISVESVTMSYLDGSGMQMIPMRG